MEAADHCRYTQAELSSPAAIQDGSKIILAVSPDLIFAPGGIQVPHGVVSSAAWIEDTYGYRPPPLPSTGPSRAPPSL